RVRFEQGDGLARPGRHESPACVACQTIAAPAAAASTTTAMSGASQRARRRGGRTTGAGFVRGPGVGSGRPARSANGGDGRVLGGGLSSSDARSAAAFPCIVVLSEARSCPQTETVPVPGVVLP